MKDNNFKPLKLAISSLVSVALITGCVQTNSGSGDAPKKNKTATYGVSGAVAGAAAGALLSSKKDRKKGAVIGAILGGVAGSAYGSYVDKQEAELREAMAGTDVEVNRTGDVIQLSMPGGVTFASNSANIASNFYGPLNNLAQSLAEYDQSRIEIVGHTDSTGSRNLNMDLSQKRAQSVANYFASNGVAMNRMNFRGEGPDFPVADNTTAQGRAKNRRVEVNLYPQ